MKYQAYTVSNFKTIPQIKRLDDEYVKAIEVVGTVLPFKTNSHIVENLINWSKAPQDPAFMLTFPQKGMLIPEHYKKIESLIDAGTDKLEIKKAADEIRWTLNPHPAGQMQYNLPVMKHRVLEGMQHKYRETVLFFPGQGQTCHAYCTFCFRWPQFTGIEGLKFASNEADQLAQYIAGHKEVTDVLFTGGDPMVMKSKLLAMYIEPMLVSRLKHLKHIRIGTKALTYWPGRFLDDDDTEDLFELFKKIKQSGKHLAIMAHFNHPFELENDLTQKAINRLLEAGAVIRTQSPLLRHINDSADIWANLWRKQVDLNCIPYYMFIARNTGAQHYFSVPLIDAWQIFRQAYNSVSGLCRTVRGPSMSCLPGKVQVLGVSEVKGEKALALRMIQGRNPDWVHRPFFARYDEEASWYTDLKPAFGEKKFFFEDELEAILKLHSSA